MKYKTIPAGKVNVDIERVGWHDDCREIQNHPCWQGECGHREGGMA